MSPASAGKSTAVTRAHSTGYPITRRSAGNDPSDQVGTSTSAAGTGARPPVPVNPRRVKPPWRLDSQEYDDPSNYLG